MSPLVQEDVEVRALTLQVAELLQAHRFKEALSEAERLVDLTKAKLGDEHGDNGIALLCVAGALVGMNRLADAEPLMRRAIAIIEAAFGAQHHTFGGALLDLAALLILTDRRDEAKPLMDRVLAIIGRALGHNSSVEADITRLTELMGDAKRLPEAVPLMRRLLTIASDPRDFALASFASARDKVLTGKRRVDKLLRSQASTIPTGTPPSARALEIEAGRLAYQIPKRMWRGVKETVEVRLGPVTAQKILKGFAGRGDIKLEHTYIVETMSVSLVCEQDAFDIEPRSQEVQLVKRDLVKGTAFHQDDFAKWVWLVTPRKTGKHTLLVQISAALKDSRGLPTTAGLPDKEFSVTVRVHLGGAAVRVLQRVALGFASAVATALVGVFTKDYWWPYVRDTLWPAVQAMVGMA